MVVLSTLRAQQGRELPVFDDAWLRAVVAKAVPAVERACGRKFRKPPTVGLADSGDAMRALRDDLEPSIGAFYAGQPRLRIQKALQLRADVVAGSLLGKYGFASKEVYVLPKLVGLNLDLVHRSEAPVDQVLQLVVVHELVHALQDQEIGLAARVRACVDADANEALAMLIEGHAVFCSERAAEELGLQAAIGPLRSVFSGSREIVTIPKADLATRRLRGQSILHYLRSAEFLQQQHAAGGDERLWQLLADPSPSTRKVLGDGKSQAAAAADLGAAFARIEDHLAGKSWTIGRGALNERRLLGENLPRFADLVAMLPSLLAGSEWFAMAPTPASWRALEVLSFVDAAAAERFCALAEDVATDDMRGSPMVFLAAPGPEGEGLSSRRLTQAPKQAFPPAARAQLNWLRHGRHVLQATFVNAPVEDAVLLDVARTLFAQLDA